MMGTVTTGLDRLEKGQGPPLRDVRVCVLCHPASVNVCLQHIVAIIANKGAIIASLLGPEHGIDASAQDMEIVSEPASNPLRNESVKEGEKRTSIAEPAVIHSLYGDSMESLRPTVQMFNQAEWLICDLQDIGARYYTYIWTVVLAAEEALMQGLQVLILDRPNPLGGLEQWVEGGGVEPGQESFVGLHSVSVRHGMTIGELVTMVLSERGAANLDRFQVLPCLQWDRSMLYPDTGLPWVHPSPNMPTWQTSMVYPGQCLLEGTNISEGRGTTKPFEILGAPWIDGNELISAIPESERPGLDLRSLHFKPMFQKWAKQNCGGLQLHIRSPNAVRSLQTSWSLLRAIYKQGRGHFRWRTEPYEFVSDRPAIDILAGGSWLRQAIECGTSVEEIGRSQENGRQAFIRRRRQFLIY